MNEQKQDAIVYFRDGSSVSYPDFSTYQLGSGFFGLLKKDGEMLIYPSDTILSIQIFPQKEQ